MKELQNTLKRLIGHRQEAIGFDKRMISVWNQEISKTLRKIKILRAEEKYKKANQNYTFEQILEEVWS